MNIVMIGGAGQLGHFALKHLSGAGHGGIAVGLGPPPESGFLPQSFRFVSMDTNAASVADLVDLLRGADAVIHGAGADGRNIFPPPAIEGFRAANVEPVLRLIAAMKQVGSRRLVILGSYYTAMDRLYPGLALARLSPYIASRLEQNQRAVECAGAEVSVSVLELPYIFGAAPGRGSLWGFYIDALSEGAGEFPVLAGGSACVTMNQVGLATARACELTLGHRNFPIGSANLSYAAIYALFARHLGVDRPIVQKDVEFFMHKAEAQRRGLEAQGLEAAYDPVGLLQIESMNMFIDPLPAMQALGFGGEDIGAAINESIVASQRFGGRGPGSGGLK